MHRNPSAEPTADDARHEHIPWWTPFLGDREQALVSDVIFSGFPNDGPVTEQLEAEFARLCRVSHAIAVTSGTTAITVSLMAAGVGHGDEVIVPDITFIASANAVALTGARPVIVDVQPDTLCIDPEAVKRAITRRTKAILPVHLSGRSANMHELMKIGQAHGFAVVEDATEALGSWIQGKSLGSIGLTGCFSLTASKMITTGQGGIIITNDDQIAERIRSLKDQGRPKRGTGFADTHPTLGYNFKYTDLQAAVGLGQLERLEGRIARLRRTCAIYQEELRNIPQIRVLPFNLQGGECPLWVDAEIDGCGELRNHLLERRIETRPFWYPLHTQAPYLESDALFPISTAKAPSCLWLPSAFTLVDDQIYRVCREIKSWSNSQIS